MCVLYNGILYSTFAENKYFTINNIFYFISFKIKNQKIKTKI